MIPSAVILALPVFLGGWIIIHDTISSYHFRHNAALATAHVPIVRSRLTADKRFDTVVVGHPFPPEWIDGSVRSQSDLDALHCIVQSTSPPVDFTWRVIVDNFVATQPSSAGSASTDADKMRDSHR